MDRFTLKTVEFKVNKMFLDCDYFSICDLDRLMKITGADRLASYRLLGVYHCVDYQEMDEETKEFVMRETLANLSNVRGFPTIGIAMPPPPAPNQLEPGEAPG